MRRLLLHIGRHKSGTTAIQCFLDDNRDLLRDRGYYVPRAGKRGEGHHLLARPLRRRLARASGLESPMTLPQYRALRDELGDTDPALAAVISSEAFQNCDPDLVKRGFPGCDTRVVVYLRKQVEYLASAYAQRVHATDYTGSIDAFYRDVYFRGSDYRRFLDDWEAVFPGRLIVRRYASSGIVEDFVGAALGLAEDGWLPARGDPNPSLNARVLQFKRMLNARDLPDKPAPDRLYNTLPALNARFPAARYRVPEHLHRELLARRGDSDRAVARRYFGDNDLFDRDLPAGEALPVLSSGDFDRMYRDLLDLAQRP